MTQGLRAALLCCLLGSVSEAEAACRQALALGLDVSGSVDAGEYRLQLDGLAAALESAAVQNALFAMSAAPVRISVYEWSGERDQRRLVPWTEIATPADLASLTVQLRGTARRVTSTGTALGSAMIYGANLLSAQSGCWRHTLDISGDGKHNIGPHPRNLEYGDDLGGITVNALVIGADDAASGDVRQADIGELSSYFNAFVIRGPDAFVETALGFAAYEAAMTRKLVRELDGFVFSERHSPPPPASVARAPAPIDHAPLPQTQQPIATTGPNRATIGDG